MTLGAFRGTLLASTLLAGVTIAAPAFAQATDPAPAPSQDPNVQAAPTDQTPATQENPADTGSQDRQDVEPAAAETIVVTGSRIVSPNITSLAPVQVIGETEIDKSGVINVQDLLLDNPAVGTPLISRTNSNFITQGNGAATIDLRDLGSNRTLVLINGRRVAGGLSVSPIVDLNVIPTQFVERIDILTGGASSLYGSDAVAGVVNFIYKRNFQGLLAEGQYGLTQRGDTPNYQVSLTMGTNFLEDRGNLMVHLGYTSEGSLLSRQRGNTRIDNRSVFWYETGDPADYFETRQPFFSGFAVQGRFDVNGTSSTADDFTFGPDGTLQPCFTSNGATCGGGAGHGPNGFNRNFFRTLAVPVKRYLFATRGHYDITDNISAILEGTYAKTSVSTEKEPFGFDTGGANPLTPSGRVNIQTVVDGPNGPVVVDNPFVPAAILAAATDRDGDGLKDLAIARRLVEIGGRNATINRDYFRFVTGFEGTLFDDRFNWDATYNVGRMTEGQSDNGQVNYNSVLSALTAVREDASTGDLNGNGTLGDIVCASEVARAQQCVPLNFFGVNSITPQAAAYIRAQTDNRNVIKQQVWSANISGTVVDLPAGPLGIALGAEYRKENATNDWDALTNAGLNGGNATPDTSGSFNVKEIFGEVNVPVFKEQPFAYQLNLRAAGRLSDYSTVGGVSTWSFGGDYAPIEDVRLRGTYAKAVRAPNIGELFAGAAQTFPTGLVDPCADIDPAAPGRQGVTLTSTGAISDNCRAAPGVIANINANGGVFTQTQADSQGISGFNVGNPNLKEETAKSLTLGVVVNPKSIDALRNLVLSVDYYQIKIADAVALPSRATILQQCYINNDPQFCQFITRRATVVGSNSAGSLAFVDSSLVNSGGLKARGIDTVLQYRTGLGAFMGTPLNMNTRISWTHLLEGWSIDLPGAPQDDFAGEIGTATDRVNATLGLNADKWGLSLTGNYIGKSHEDDVSLAAFTGNGPHAVHIDPQFYLDGQISFTPVREYEFFFGVDNIMDHKAPKILSGSSFNITGTKTAADVYDIFGRRFYAGARLRF